ncbi:iron complex transport system substrate-binding protein [Leucobacter exalbidus]|uniref:Iron complex transport system substrate-binding protein n=1 Tax=Leucobacter exalbidus TaxID=662960 RepID=A0A940PKB0_9MICO|nr:ABC transporter substrate-binding protein [Leucobacter exalbidus]MBP1325492.1 iron complex transport system substrate-binding protein [Leucobacter exalbidus]
MVSPHTLRTTGAIRRTRVALALGATLALAAGLTACAPEPTDPAANISASTDTVTITDNHGEIAVPVNPQRVVALDNTAFDTLAAWDVDLVAAPKGVMGSAWPGYTDDDAVLDIGTHREPNLEMIVAAEPDLIIGGYRFSDQYAEIKKQNPDATVIEIAPRDGEDQFAELKRQTEILGQIFDHEDEAAALNTQLDDAIADAKSNYPTGETVMAVNTSAGQIGYIAPGIGRSLGSIFGALDLTPALEVKNASNDHQGDDISVEAIADSNPDWIFALDRDASFAPAEREAGSAPANELIRDAEALAQVPAVTKQQIVILDPNFYLTEGIQAYTALFTNISEAFAAA